MKRGSSASGSGRRRDSRRAAGVASAHDEAGLPQTRTVSAAATKVRVISFQTLR